MHTRILPLALIALAIATPAIAQSKADALVKGTGEATEAPAASDDQLISPAASEAIKDQTKTIDDKIRPHVTLDDQVKARAPKGWWTQLWDAIHEFDFGKIISLLVQPIPLIVIVVGGFGIWFFGRRR